MPRRIALVVVLAAVVAGVVWYLRTDRRPMYFTGFVEGEERVLRSEVSGRVLEVKYAEGQEVPARAPVAVLDTRDIRARLAAKQEELNVVDTQIRTQIDRIEMLERTWARDLNARRADVKQAESVVDLAERTFVRERDLVSTGASTAQLLDDSRARRDQARSALDRAREIAARTEAEEYTIVLARRELDTLRQQRVFAQAQIDELQVTHSKFVISAPEVATVMQTQFIWPGELAQAGTAVASVLDPRDKYVQVYVPVSEIGRVHLEQPVEIELDSRPGERVRGEISFIADKANFTPEKIETRSDRMGQVYRVKVRVLDGAEGLRPGTEGNVYLSKDGARPQGSP